MITDSLRAGQNDVAADPPEDEVQRENLAWSIYDGLGEARATLRDIKGVDYGLDAICESAEQLAFELGRLQALIDLLK